MRVYPGNAVKGKMFKDVQSSLFFNLSLWIKRFDLPSPIKENLFLDIVIFSN